MGSWRVLVGDAYGNTIANVSPIAFEKQLTQTLNRPAVFSFKVPANDKRVASLASDGYPKVGEGRTVRAYRQEPQADGSHRWVPRFAGYVWQVQDEGSANDEWTTCTCFDPFQVLAHRYARVMGFSPADGGLFITQTP